MLASTLSRPRCGIPMHDLVELVLGGARQDAVEQRDDRLAALEREALLADELGLQEGLERLGGVEPAQDAQLLLAGGLGVADLDLGLDPLALLGVLDVHVLDADGAAVRVAQDAEDLAQLEERLAAEPAGGEGAVEVPQGQAVAGDVEVLVAPLLVLQRVGVGHQVAAHAVGVDELLHPGDLVDVVVVRGVDVAHPADRLVGDAQALEDLVVEAVLAEQERVHHAQEVAGLGALDDPVVVGAGEREDLADGVAVERLQAGAEPLGGVLERADADDRALALHQAGHRVHGADGAGVGERDRGALEVLDGQLAAAGLLDHLLVGGPEVGEVHRLGGLDRGHQQLAGAVGLGEVDGQAEVDVRGGDEHRLAPLVVPEAVVHLGHHAQRLDQREPDEVREAHLAAAAAGEVVVDDDAVVDEQLRGHRAHRGGGGHLERGLHVGDDAGAGAADGGLAGVAERPGRLRAPRPRAASG